MECFIEAHREPFSMVEHEIRSLAAAKRPDPLVVVSGGSARNRAVRNKVDAWTHQHLAANPLHLDDITTSRQYVSTHLMDSYQAWRRTLRID